MQDPAPRPSPDERTPEQMPTTAKVEWYDATRSIGVLVTSDGARFSFDGDVLKRVKDVELDAVTVVWKRARAGAWNVPALVTQAGVKALEPAPHFTLEAWLEGFNERTGKRVTLEDHECIDEWDGTEATSWMLVSAIGELPAHKKWIRSFDWKDGEALVEAFGLIGKGQQLFSLDTGGDNYVVIVLPPAACAKLVEDRLIKTCYIEPPPKHRGLSR
jgi:hypothetical protein